MANPKLSEIQSWLQWVVVHPEGVSMALAENDWLAPFPHCIEFIKSSDNFSKINRLQVYSNAYILRLRDVLAKDFPRTVELIGNERFEPLVEQFLSFYPSADFNIGEVGRHWPMFLDQHETLKSMPYLSALASVEWAVGTTYFSACLSPIDPDRLKIIPTDGWDQAKFTLDPTIRFMQSDWAIHKILDGDFRNDSQLPEIPKRQAQLIIHRTEENGIRVKPVSRTEFEILSFLNQGHSLSVVLDAVGVTGEGYLDNLKSWFSSWIRDGVIRRVSFEG